MRTTLVVISLLALFIYVQAGSRRLMKPAYGFGDDILREKQWGVLAVYSQQNMDFFEQTKCLTLSYSNILKPGVKQPKQKSHSESSAYFYSSSSDTFNSESDSGEDTTNFYLGFQQNMSWFNLSTGTYDTQFINLDYGRWSKSDSQSGVFLEDNLKDSDDEWIVSYGDGNFLVMGRKDATELYLMMDLSDYDMLSDSEEEYPINEAYHAFNASLLDTTNVIYTSTYTNDCKVDSTPLQNFSLTSFAQKPWYSQLVYMPLLGQVDPASKEICFEMVVNNISNVNGLNVVQFNFSNYVHNQTGGVEWITVQYDYWQDPHLNSVFRPMEQGLATANLFDPSMSMVFYHQNQQKGDFFFGYGNTGWAWIITESNVLENSDEIENELSDLLSKLDWESTYEDFYAGSCNYNQH